MVNNNKRILSLYCISFIQVWYVWQLRGSMDCLSKLQPAIGTRRIIHALAVTSLNSRTYPIRGAIIMLGLLWSESSHFYGSHALLFFLLSCNKVLSPSFVLGRIQTKVWLVAVYWVSSMNLKLYMCYINFNRWKITENISILSILWKKNDLRSSFWI